MTQTESEYLNIDVLVLEVKQEDWGSLEDVYAI